MLYYVYVLKSLSSKYFYIGQTDNITNRLTSHNAGRVESTRRYRPWKIHYFENFSDKINAVKREKYFQISSHTIIAFLTSQNLKKICLDIFGGKNIIYNKFQPSPDKGRFRIIHLGARFGKQFLVIKKT